VWPFREIKVRVSSLCNFLESRVIRSAGLRDHLAFCFSPSGTARHLGGLLKGPFSRPEMGKVKNTVGIYNTNYRDVIKIQALGNHLGSYENINIAGAKIFQYPLVSILAPGGV